MSLIEIIFVGISLAMDAFAVAVSGGLTMKKVKIADALKIALCFGFFQALMPFIGWSAASVFSNFIEKFDHWIALILLCYIGGKMIYDGIFKDEENFDKDITKFCTLILLGIATSIDALMVGITFVTSFVGIQIVTPVSIIGITTFLISVAGVYFGKKFGDILGGKAEIIGGILLVAIGLKIFFF